MWAYVWRRGDVREGRARQRRGARVDGLRSHSITFSPTCDRGGHRLNVSYLRRFFAVVASKFLFSKCRTVRHFGRPTETFCCLSTPSTAHTLLWPAVRPGDHLLGTLDLF
jgi:hypothetical protein